MHEDLFCRKNNQLELMELNQIYPGKKGPYILNENFLQEQKLDETATKNIMCFKEMVESHNIPIFFNDFHPHRYFFDNQMISFSDTKSIFQFELKVCLREVFQSDFDFEVNQEVVERLHEAIAFMRERMNVIEFGQEDQEQIQDYFVMER